MDCSFQKADETHLPDILDIYTYYILNTTATFHTKPLTLTEMKELVFFESPKYQAYVMKVENIICGYVVLSQHKKREAYDRTGEIAVYIRNDFTGKGLGSKAVKFIERIAKNYDFHVLIASISGDNEKSIRLFERNGFTKCAHYGEVGIKFGKWLDVVVYQKIL